MYIYIIAPSGHILSNQELQVLTNLLATYSDEKLSEIKLSIEEKQGIKRISREEVEKSLRQSGLMSVADGLKENIEKGIYWNKLTHTPKCTHMCILIP